MPVDEKAADRQRVLAAVVVEPDDQVEAALADEDLGLLLADEPDAHGADDVAVSPTRATAGRSTTI